LPQKLDEAVRDVLRSTIHQYASRYSTQHFGHIANSHRAHRRIARQRLFDNVWGAFIVAGHHDRICGIQVKRQVRSANFSRENHEPQRAEVLAGERAGLLNQIAALVWRSPSTLIEQYNTFEI
jgi:hypothetical protein